MKKSSSPPLEANRSMKRAKFKENGVDGDNPPPVSFKGKLMEQRAMKEELMGKDEDMEFDIGDVVVVEKEGVLPSISFLGRSTHN